MGYVPAPPPLVRFGNVEICAYCGRVRTDDHDECPGCGSTETIEIPSLQMHGTLKRPRRIIAE